MHHSDIESDYRDRPFKEMRDTGLNKDILQVYR